MIKKFIVILFTTFTLITNVSASSDGELLLEKNKPGESLKLAVKRMLPGGVLGRKQLTKVKIYAGEDHPHAAQNPKLLDLRKLNSKNLSRN